jgi:hypothetical protein
LPENITKLQTRKEGITMKKKIIVLSIITYTVLIATAIGYKNNLFAIVTNKNDIPPLTFSLPGEPAPQRGFTYELKASVLKNEEDIDVYKLISKNVNKSKFKEIAGKLSFVLDEAKITFSKENGYMYRDGDAYINVEENGRLIYSSGKDSIDKKQNHILPSDEEAERIAKNYLQDKGLLPKEFFVASVAEGLVQEFGNGVKDVITKQVTFHRYVGLIQAIE